MTNEEYIKQHPEQFKDDIDKWLFTEFGIIGGCCSAEKSHEYSVARMVAEKLTDAFIEKTRKYFIKELPNFRSFMESETAFIKNFESFIQGE